MTDTRDLPDDDLRTLVRAAGSPAGIDFRADLRARLAAAIDGDVELDPVEPADHRRTWLPIVAAAAVVALVVGTIAVIARERDPELGQATDLATQLVGPTWVALDTPFVPQVLTLEFTQDADGTLRLVGTANDGCNSVSGPFRLVDDVITSDEMAQTLMYCGPGLTASLQPGTTRLTLDDAALTLDDGERQTVYRALESLDPVEGDQLDGLWAAGPTRIRIVDGEVTGTGPEPVTDVPDGDTFPAEFADALTAGIAEAWAYGESLIVRTPTTGLRRLDPAGPAPSTDLATQLVGRTWVVMDGVPPGDLPTLVMKSGTTGPDVIIVNGDDGCNTHSGEFRLDGTTVVDAEIVTTLVPCGEAAATMPAQGASLSIDGDILTVSDGQGASGYRALESLPAASVDALDGLWSDGSVQFAIADGRVVEPVPDGTATDLDRALATDTLAAWAWGDVLVVQTSTNGFRLLEPVAGTGSTNLLDELVGRTWVGVGGDWQTASPTLVFDSLNREPGLSAVSTFDGCNSGGGTFELDGATMTGTEIFETDAPCPHAIALLAEGTNLAVTDGTNLAVTDTTGLTTFYVALDSLEPVPDTDLPAALDGVWEFAGSVFTIDGDTIGSQGSAPTAVWELFSGTVRATGVEAWRRDRDLVVSDGSTFLVLGRSDLPVGGSPVVTTGPLTGGDEALILGTVTVEHGCLVTTFEGIRYPLVWQAGTSWDGVDTVILPDGVNVPMGQAIEAGGGYYAADQLEGFGIDAAGIDTMRGCAERIGPEIAVIQSPVTLQFPATDGG